MVPPKVASKLTESLAHPELTAREFQVLRQITAGRSNKEIGQKLHITEHTVKAHVKAILSKLGAIGRTKAIAIGLQVVSELMSNRAPKPRIIVITTYEREDDIRRAVIAGAKGYLVKVADPEQIEEAVREVAAGRSLFPTEIILKLAESVAHPDLSKRELQVLQHIADGRSNKEIGAILYISEATVKGHVGSILTKLEAIGRAEAIAIATKRGLIQGKT